MHVDTASATEKPLDVIAIPNLASLVPAESRSVLAILNVTIHATPAYLQHCGGHVASVASFPPSCCRYCYCFRPRDGTLQSGRAVLLCTMIAWRRCYRSLGTAPCSIPFDHNFLRDALENAVDLAGCSARRDRFGSRSRSYHPSRCVLFPFLVVERELTSLTSLQTEPFDRKLAAAQSSTCVLPCTPRAQLRCCIRSRSNVAKVCSSLSAVVGWRHSR